MGTGTIEGTQGTLTLGGDGSARLRRFGDVDETMWLPPDTWDGFGGDCVHALQSHVIAACLDGAPLENTARAYLTVREIEEAIYASDAAGRKQSLS